MQSKDKLQIAVADDMNDEAAEIINRETKKLMENEFIEKNGFMTSDVAKEISEKVDDKLAENK